MKRLLFLIGAGFSALLTAQSSWNVTSEGYEIVLPESTGNAASEGILKNTAGMMHRAIRNSAGISLDIVTEKKHDPGKKAIFLGPVSRLSSLVKTSSLDRWEHGIEVKEGNIYLYGRDQDANAHANTKKHYSGFMLGSVKAATVFLETFAGIRFVTPSAQEHPPFGNRSLTVPEGFHYRKKPVIQYCSSGQMDLFYDLALNGFYPSWLKTYGGHSHPAAIPVSLYGRHPEYFALSKGKRVRSAQYCLSNPAVQDLILAEVKKQLDCGYETVQLSQSDGFLGCDCAKCRDWYKVSGWGEKLWLFHRDIAVKLLKSHPKRKVMILSYGPTQTPPKTFSEFPANVIIELTDYSESRLNVWSKYKVPAGFSAYIHNWGTYHLEGLTPKMSLLDIAGQVKLFHKYNIRGIYRCGFGELPGMEGPAYYIWGKMLESPGLDPEKLLGEYCRYSFGPAADEMVKFYLLLDSRLKIKAEKNVVKNNDGTVGSIWNDRSLLSGKFNSMKRNQHLLSLRYPPPVLAKLSEHLRQAESRSCPLKLAGILLKQIRTEFTYLADTMAVINAFQKYRETTARDDFQETAKAVIQRRKWIDALPKPGPASPFRYIPKERLHAGGNLLAVLKAPFTWDMEWMLENGVQPSGRVMADHGSPQYLVQRIFTAVNPLVKESPVLFQCYTDPQAFHAILIFRSEEERKLKGTSVSLFFERSGKRWHICSGVAKNSRAMVLIRSGKKPSGDTYTLRRDLSANLVVKGNTAEFQLPWKTFGGTPYAGEKIRINTICDRKKGSLVWEYDLEKETWNSSKDVSGTFIVKGQ